jgi:hypothetical protein
MGKLGFWLPRNLSRMISTRREDSPEPFHVQENTEEAEDEADRGLRRRPATSGLVDTLPQHVRRIGRTIINTSRDSSRARTGTQPPIPMAGGSSSTSNAGGAKDDQSPSQSSPNFQGSSEPSPTFEAAAEAHIASRTIRYPDE